MWNDGSESNLLMTHITSVAVNYLVTFYSPFPFPPPPIFHLVLEVLILANAYTNAPPFPKHHIIFKF